MDKQYTAQKIEPYTERNEELIKDYKAGKTITELVIKYRISSARIYQLIHSSNTEVNNPKKEKEENSAHPSI